MPAFTTGRCLVAAAIISFAPVTNWHFESAADSDLRAASNVDVTQLPLVLGDWSGQNLKPDERVVKQIGAINLVDRKYINANGETLLLSLASFPAGAVTIPHPPDRCYSGSGWKVLNETWQTSSSKHRYKLLRVEMDHQLALVSYWYQLRTEVASNRDELRNNLQKFRWRGQNFPALVKVMIHAQADVSETDVKSASEDLGTVVFEWIEQNT